MVAGVRLPEKGELEDQLWPMIKVLARRADDVAGWIDEPCVADITLEESDEAFDVAFGYGYLRATADANGMTAREVLTACGVDLDALVTAARDEQADGDVRTFTVLLTRSATYEQTASAEVQAATAEEAKRIAEDIATDDVLWFDWSDGYDGADADFGEPVVRDVEPVPTCPACGSGVHQCASGDPGCLHCNDDDCDWMSRSPWVTS